MSNEYSINNKCSPQYILSVWTSNHQFVLRISCLDSSCLFLLTPVAAQHWCCLSGLTVTSISRVWYRHAALNNKNTNKYPWMDSSWISDSFTSFRFRYRKFSLHKKLKLKIKDKDRSHSQLTYPFYVVFTSRVEELLRHIIIKSFPHGCRYWLQRFKNVSWSRSQ